MQRELGCLVDRELVTNDLLLLAISALQAIHSESQEGKQSKSLSERRRGGWGGVGKTN